MISNIIDNNGFLVFRGNDVDEKFSRVLSREGHSRVDVNHHEFEKPRWDGAKWIEGETDLEVWQKEMVQSDRSLMPRYLEDLITDKFAGNAGTSLQERYDKKIKIRGERP
jgi:hypothetical protein